MAMGQQPPPPLGCTSASTPTMSSEPLPSSSSYGHGSAYRKRPLPLPDSSTGGDQIPYKIKKTLVDNIMVPCINARAYQNTDLMITLAALARHFFPRVSSHTCRTMLDAVGVSTYKPNAAQLQVLRKSGNPKSAGELMNLVPINDVVDHLKQFRNLLRWTMSGEQHASRSLLPTRPPRALRPSRSSAPPLPKRARAN